MFETVTDFPMTKTEIEEEAVMTEEVEVEMIEEVEIMMIGEVETETTEQVEMTEQVEVTITEVVEAVKIEMGAAEMIKEDQGPAVEIGNGHQEMIVGTGNEEKEMTVVKNVNDQDPRLIKKIGRAVTTELKRIDAIARKVRRKNEDLEVLKRERKKLRRDPTVKNPNGITKRVRRGARQKGHHLQTAAWSAGRRETEAMRGETG